VSVECRWNVVVRLVSAEVSSLSRNLLHGLPTGFCHCLFFSELASRCSAASQRLQHYQSLFEFIYIKYSSEISEKWWFCIHSPWCVHCHSLRSFLCSGARCYLSLTGQVIGYSGRDRHPLNTVTFTFLFVFVYFIQSIKSNTILFYIIYKREILKR